MVAAYYGSRNQLATELIPTKGDAVLLTTL
jgi:hypothetical protein